MEKVCIKCKIVKTEADFHKRSPTKLRTTCKQCRAIQHKTTPLQNKESNLKRTYRITLSQFNIMLVKQNNKCLICLKEMNKPNVDHCHKTGKVRGLLCTHCNFGLGHFHESLEFLTNAINYIKEHNEPN